MGEAAEDGERLMGADAGGTRPQAHPDWPARLDRPKTHEEAMIGRASPEAIEIYQRLKTVIMAPEFMDEFMSSILWPHGWDMGTPLTQEQQDWLLRHQGVIEDLMALAAAGGMPGMSFEETLALLKHDGSGFQDLMNVPVPDFLFAQTCARMLTLESQRLREGGDMARAAEVLLAIAPLAGSIREPTLIGHLVGVAMQRMATTGAAQWLEAGSMPPEVARQLRAGFGNSGLDLENLHHALQLEYLCNRTGAVMLVNAPLLSVFRQTMNDPTYQGPWQKDNFLEQIGFMGNRLIKNPLGTFGGAWKAVVLRVNADGEINKLDQFWERKLDRIAAGDIEAIDWSPYQSYLSPPDFTSEAVRTAVSQARVNLVRAGLDHLLGQPSDAMDPFTGEPLRVIERDSETLIYSLGPDRTDHHGEIQYDPRNGTFSAGDIFIRIGR